MSVDGSVNQIRTAKEPPNDLNFSDLHKETSMEASLELVIEYEVEPPFSSVKIVRDIRTGTVSYIVNEPDVGREAIQNFLRSAVLTLRERTVSRG